MWGPGTGISRSSWRKESEMAVESPGWDPEDRAKYSQQTTLRMIGEAGLEVIRTETFLPVQNIYICTSR
jgi:hypothetical protein